MTQVLDIADIKKRYPDEWVLLGNPIMDSSKIDVLSGIPIFHSKDKKEVCYIGRNKKYDFDKINLIFKGTSVVKGNARAIVTGTGLQTELGKITRLVETAKQGDTPLEKKLQGLTKILMVVTAAFAGIFIISGLLQDKQFYIIVETALALAVAAIPEGLPVVSIIALTYGMLRLARKRC